MKVLRIAAPAAREACGTGLEASEFFRLSGRVARGRGGGTFVVRRNAGKIRDALGASVIEGTLNIILKRPAMFRDDTAVQIHFDRGTLRLAWPGRLNGTDVWFHRWQGAPVHIVEVLATVHLRKHLHLSDGDDVQIDVRKCDMGRISNVGWMTWILFWLGRKKWTYTKWTSTDDCYYIQASRWCRKFGASQLDTEKNCGDLAMAIVKAAIKKIPGARWLRASLRRHD
jgi:hypothetical protein